jgi:hypothetical protein
MILKDKERRGCLDGHCERLQELLPYPRGMTRQMMLI